MAIGYAFERFESLIDIGGGNGHILAEILDRHPQLRGALFELTPTAAVARGFLSKRQLTARWEVFEGDFFEAVPSGYDAYMIKSCQHDWNDAKDRPGNDGDTWGQGTLAERVCFPPRSGGTKARNSYAHRGKLLLRC
jgi:hypothetical protein